MKRRHYPYTEWEDYRAGMYRPSERVAEHVALSADLLRDLPALREAMYDAVESWPTSASQNLTDSASNRRSWLGQAACCITHGSPEWTTCQAWWMLTDDEREAANAVASEVIAGWEAGVSRAQTTLGF